MEERRKNPRFRINQLIAYGPSREEYVFADSLNLSREGLSGASSQMVHPMTNVFIMMRVPAPGAEGGESQVRCEGYVSHAHMDGGRCLFGIKITSVYDSDAAAFEAYLSSLTAAPPAAGAP